MSLPVMRPRFEMTVNVSPEEALRRIQAWSSDPECACGIMTTQCQVDVLVPEQRRHVWSPWLTLKAVKLEEGGTKLTGRFAPHPSIWTLFMSLYALMAFIAIVGACWGMAQMTLDQSPWAFWAVPAATIIGVGLFVGSTIGQRLGHDQMEDLRHCVGDLFIEGEEAPPSGLSSSHDESYPPIKVPLRGS